MISKINLFVKKYNKDIVLFVAIFLISLISFSFGYIIDKEKERESLEFEIPIIDQINENT